MGEQQNSSNATMFIGDDAAEELLEKAEHKFFSKRGEDYLYFADFLKNIALKIYEIELKKGRHAKNYAQFKKLVEIEQKYEEEAKKWEKDPGYAKAAKDFIGLNKELNQLVMKFTGTPENGRTAAGIAAKLARKKKRLLGKFIEAAGREGEHFAEYFYNLETAYSVFLPRFLAKLTSGEIMKMAPDCPRNCLNAARAQVLEWSLIFDFIVFKTRVRDAYPSIPSSASDEEFLGMMPTFDMRAREIERAGHLDDSEISKFSGEILDRFFRQAMPRIAKLSKRKADKVVDEISEAISGLRTEAWEKGAEKLGKDAYSMSMEIRRVHNEIAYDQLTREEFAKKLAEAAMLENKIMGFNGRKFVYENAGKIDLKILSRLSREILTDYWERTGRRDLFALLLTETRGYEYRELARAKKIELAKKTAQICLGLMFVYLSPEISPLELEEEWEWNARPGKLFLGRVYPKRKHRLTKGVP